MTLQKVIFDTSAVRRFSDDRKGADIIEQVLEKSISGKIQTAISCLTIFEIMLLVGKQDYKKAVSVIEFLKKSGVKVIPTSEIVCNEAANLGIKYSEISFSLADLIIIATGIEENAEIITSDKEWQKVKEARVKVI